MIMTIIIWTRILLLIMATMMMMNLAGWWRAEGFSFRPTTRAGGVVPCRPFTETPRHLGSHSPDDVAGEAEDYPYYHSNDYQEEKKEESNPAENTSSSSWTRTDPSLTEMKKNNDNDHQMGGGTWWPEIEAAAVAPFADWSVVDSWSDQSRQADLETAQRYYNPRSMLLLQQDPVGLVLLQALPVGGREKNPPPPPLDEEEQELQYMLEQILVGERDHQEHRLLHRTEGEEEEEEESPLSSFWDEEIMAQEIARLVRCNQPESSSAAAAAAAASSSITPMTRRQGEEEDNLLWDECEIIHLDDDDDDDDPDQVHGGHSLGRTTTTTTPSSSHQKVELAADQQTPLYIHDGHFVFIDEESCIGCTQCVSAAPASFRMTDQGRARAFCQRMAPDVRTAVQSCPVDCMHYLSFRELQDLETARDQALGWGPAPTRGADRRPPPGGTPSVLRPLHVTKLAREGNHRSSLYHDYRHKCSSSPACPERGCFDCPRFQSTSSIPSDPTGVHIKNINPYFLQQQKRATHIRAQHFIQNGMADTYRRTADL